MVTTLVEIKIFNFIKKKIKILASLVMIMILFGLPKNILIHDKFKELPELI